MEETITRISKAGRNLFARIPDDARDKFFAGDKVKIELIEKAVNREDQFMDVFNSFIKKMEPVEKNNVLKRLQCFLKKK